MLSIPSAAEAIFMSFSVAFTQPTFQRVLLLVSGALMTFGRRTVTAVLWTLRGATDGHPSSYHRVFSRAVWSLWPLGKVLTRAVLAYVPRDELVLVPMDDATAQHRGQRVYGKGCHHDAGRSAPKHIVYRWGHRWIVLTISVRFPFTARRWALPVLVALYRPKDLDQLQRRRHKTAPEIARQLMAVLIHWFPERRFVFLGDGGYASHDLARFCYRHRRHASLVRRYHGDANLYGPPPKRQKRTGRPRIKGRKLPSPHQVVASHRLTVVTVGWYGGADHRVALTSDIGYWYKSGRGSVPIHWVFVRDCQGTHRDEYFYTTDLALTAVQIVTWFTARWAIETTFQEIRAHLGFETPRQYVATSVLRTAPCLLGLFSVTCLIFAEHTRSHRIRMKQTLWYVKAEPTFSDAIATVRRLFWQESVFEKGPYHKDFAKLSPRLRSLLLEQLSRAA